MNRNSFLSRRLSPFVFGIGLSLLAGGMVASAFAQDAKPADAKPADAKDATPYSWTYKYAKGDIIRYRVAANITGKVAGNDLNIVFKQQNREEIKSIADNGEVTYDEIVEAQESLLNDMPLPGDADPKKVVATRTLSKNGLFVKVKYLVEAPGMEGLRKLEPLVNAVPTPEKPVKIGDTWKTEIENPYLPGKKLTLTSTLAGKEKVTGVDALKVQYKVDVPTKEGANEETTLKMESVYFVDVATGRLMKQTYTLTNMPIESQAGTLIVKLEATTTRIVPGVNDKEDKKEAGK